MSDEIESLSQLCKALYTHDQALDVISLHVPITDLVYAMTSLERLDLETLGDPQTAVSYLGDAVLFLQTTLARYNVTAS